MKSKKKNHLVSYFIEEKLYNGVKGGVKEKSSVVSVVSVRFYPFLATIESLGYEGGSVGYSALKPVCLCFSIRHCGLHRKKCNKAFCFKPKAVRSMHTKGFSITCTVCRLDSNSRP